MTLYRVIKAYGPWPAGHIFTAMPGNVGRTLIGRGLVAEVADEVAAEEAPDAAEEKSLQAPADRMMRPSTYLSKRKENR